MRYNWERENWPNFEYDLSGLKEKLDQYARDVSFLAGQMTGLTDGLRYDLVVENLATEALYNSQIEGVRFSLDDLKSSILNNLYPDVKQRHVKDYKAIYLGKIMSLNRSSYAESLSEDMLFEWHSLLLSHRADIDQKGGWRISKEPMRIVSGGFGQEKVHFVAPPSVRVPEEMKAFISWFNEYSLDKFNLLSTSPVRAGIAHLYFEAIHPFEDGNGRIGRLIAEKSLAQQLGFPLPFSLSYAIAHKPSAYYAALQTGTYRLDLTNWLTYFVDTCLLALDLGKKTINLTVRKAHFYAKYGDQLSTTNLKAIGKMFGTGPKGFQGGMTANKYVRINRVSKPTATRELAELTRIGALERRGAGRSTHYVLPGTEN